MNPLVRAKAQMIVYAWGESHAHTNRDSIVDLVAMVLLDADMEREAFLEWLSAQYGACEVADLPDDVVERFRQRPTSARPK